MMKNGPGGRWFLESLITSIILSFAWIKSVAAVAVESFI